MQTTTPAIPKRGELLPWLSGTDNEGAPRSTRDWYMRRNLAVVFVDADDRHGWVSATADVLPAAREEASDVVIVAPPGVDTGDLLPVIRDGDGSLAAKCGLRAADLPAIFIIDRWGTVFAASRGETAVALEPEDIPGWLEFVACRCT